MQDWLSARAKVSPNTLALIYDDERWSYQQLDHKAAIIAGQLASAGVRAGQHMAVLMEPDADYVALLYALMRLNVVLVPLNTRLTTEGLIWQVEHADVEWLLYSEVHQSTAAQLPVSTKVMLSDLPLSQPVASADIALDGLQAIVFTSGTTSSPKGVQLTVGNHFYSAMASAYRIGLQSNDLWLSCLPLYHVGGLAVFFRSCLYGTAVLLHNRFDVARVSAALEQLPVTMVSLVPTMLYRLLEHRSTWRLPHLRCVLLGGAAAQAELLARAFSEGIPIHTTYGLTEASSQVATLLPDEVRKKPLSVGKPLLFSEVKIVDEAGATQASEKIGEVWVKGPTVMQGYYKNAEATQRALQDGWLRTGDIGYTDADGDLFVLQRRSDLLVSGGENVLPSEVEAVLKRHEAVADVIVVGLDDPEWGQKVAAAIILSGDVTAEALQDYARAHLAGPKLPRVIRFVDAYPMTASGKVQRNKVRDLFDA